MWFCYFLASLHVLHGFFKQHQVHVRVQLIVVLKSVHQGLLKLLQVSHLCVTRLTHTVSEMGVDQWLVDKNRLIYTLQRERESKRLLLINGLPVHWRPQQVFEKLCSLQSIFCLCLAESCWTAPRLSPPSVCLNTHEKTHAAIGELGL